MKVEVYLSAQSLMVRLFATREMRGYRYHGLVLSAD